VKRPEKVEGLKVDIVNGENRLLNVTQYPVYLLINPLLHDTRGIDCFVVKISRLRFRAEHHSPDDPDVFIPWL
jgi:hypothetical protein